jgi:hypothetical protein
MSGDTADAINMVTVERLITKCPIINGKGFLFFLYRKQNTTVSGKKDRKR